MGISVISLGYIRVIDWSILQQLEISEKSVSIKDVIDIICLQEEIQGITTSTISQLPTLVLRGPDFPLERICKHFLVE